MQSGKVKNKVDEDSTKSNLTAENVKMSNKYKLSDEKNIDHLENAESIFKTIKTGKKIINLNLDCMQTIFMHLDFNDLLNVADSNAQFYSAVCQVYKRKFLNMKPIVDRHTGIWSR